MRISDRSSDVCSSDLLPLRPASLTTSGPGIRSAPSSHPSPNSFRLARVPRGPVGPHAATPCRSVPTRGNISHRLPIMSDGRDRLKDGGAPPFSSADRARRFSFGVRSEEHTSELQSLMRISYAVFCLKKKTKHNRKCKQHTPTKHTK